LALLALVLVPSWPTDAAEQATGRPVSPADDLLAAARSPGAEPVEEVLAVVDRTPILRSDIELARLVALIPPDPALVPNQSIQAEQENQNHEDRALDPSTDDEYRSSLLDLRINLELEYRDLELSGVVFRLRADVEGALESLIARAGGREQLEPRLEAAGLLWSDVEDLALRVAVTSAYVEERLRPQITVSLEQLEEAYQQRVVARLAGEPDLPPLGAVREQLHSLLVEQKLNREIELWLEAARERLEVTRFAP
jgi:hypothetical protein